MQVLPIVLVVVQPLVDEDLELDILHRLKKGIELVVYLIITPFFLLQVSVLV